MKTDYHITEVDHLGGFRLRLTFSDGLIADVDLSSKLQGGVGPMFEPLRNEAFFARVVVDKELGTIVWPNGADLAPDVLHDQALRAS
jgi:hypothetical protein